MGKRRRRRYIIEGNFQTRFILRFLLIIVGSTLLSTVAILGLFYIKYQMHGVHLNELIIMIGNNKKTNPASFFEMVLAPLIISNLFILCIVIPISLFYSHRIAGPIYRFQKSLDMLIDGETNFMIVLRKKDEFKYLADKMNTLIDYLRRNINEVKISHKLIKDRIAKINNLISSEPIDIPQLKRELNEIERFFNDRGVPFSY